jgi:hypothetical protein
MRRAGKRNVVGAVASLFLLSRAGTLTAQMHPPFTEDEIFQVMRRFVPDLEARAVAAEMLKPVDSQGESGHGSRVTSVDFSTDMLILLSLLSPETSEKVEKWRRRLGSEVSEEEQRHWEKRRLELIRWAEAGYPKLPERNHPP